MNNKKIALVCQRYGEEVNGGAEYYSRQLAEHLSQYYEIDVLTTRALSHMNWENYYSAGCEKKNSVLIRRFTVNKQRNWAIMNIAYWCYKYLNINNNWINKIWIKAQGPYSPDLIHYIELNEQKYSAFIFVTYLYYPTVFGMPKVAQKSIFVPTAHEEYAANFNIFKTIFKLPKAIVFLTNEEKEFVQSKYGNELIKNDVLAMGIENPKTMWRENFKKKYDVTDKYILYVGRVEKEKNCQEMFDFFMRYSEEDREISLVVMGKTDMEIPKCDKIKYVGYVSEEDKQAAIEDSYMIWIPSEFESLSIVLLEAMAMGKPVVVNELSNVLLGHCKRSHAGISYKNYKEFEEKMKSMTDKKYLEMSRNAKIYIEKFYQWDVILENWKKLIEYL